MQISQIMTPDPDTAQLQDTLQAVAAKMDSGDYGSVPVIDGGRLVGVVTDRDIAVRAVAQGLGPDTRVGEVMTRSEERRVGKECYALCRSRWSPYH